jgi:hypothetical protein
MAGVARDALTVIYHRPHLPHYPTTARIAIASASGEHVSSHAWICRRREEIGKKYQHSHTRRGRVYGKEEKPMDDARCALNAAITR